MFGSLFGKHSSCGQVVHMIKVDGKERPWRPGMTVADLLQELPDPSYKYAVIRLNRDIVAEPFFAKTQIPDNAEIYLIPMVVGG